MAWSLCMVGGGEGSVWILREDTLWGIAIGMIG